MRILLVHQYFLEDDDHGGSRFNEMTKTWKGLGHDISVIAGMVHPNGSEKNEEYKGKFYIKKKQNGIDVHRCHVSSGYNSGFLGRLIGYFSFVFSSIFAGLFKAKGKYDVIIITSPPLFLGITAVVLSFFKRTPYVFEVRDLWPESAIDTGVITNKWLIKFSYWFEKKVYYYAKLINVLTPAFKKVLIKKGVPENKILFIPNAADFALSDELLTSFDARKFKKELGFENKFVITYVGAHGIANHLVQLLEAAALLKNTNVIIQMIGGGMQKEWLINETNRMQLNNVIFRDPVPKAEVFKYILASDMGASVLKKVDAFKTIYSNKTFDYMACKKPILLCIDGVSKDLIEDANCGVFAEPENPIKIAECIRQYIDNPKRLMVEGLNGYEFAKINFDREVLAIKYIEQIKTSL